MNLRLINNNKNTTLTSNSLEDLNSQKDRLE